MAEKIKAGEVSDGESLRDINRRNWPGLKSAEEVRSAVNVLETYGWLRLKKIETGARPKEIIRLNPLLGEGVDLM